MTKVIRNQEQKKMILKLKALMSKLRDLDKEVGKLKRKIKEDYEIGSYKVDDLLLQITETERSGLDKGKLLAEMGEDFVSDFLKVTTYSRIEILEDKEAA